jgi:hypothetical protein
MAALLLYHLNPIARYNLAIGLNRHAPSKSAGLKSPFSFPLPWKKGEGKDIERILYTLFVNISGMSLISEQRAICSPPVMTESSCASRDKKAWEDPTMQAVPSWEPARAAPPPNYFGKLPPPQQGGQEDCLILQVVPSYTF